ncbi:extracellular solute-binding protein [Microbacterium sp. zg.Y1090]|uniref:extracellular solute-binding protein n=1 Tax=Microbacterium TaxID=33882 RepID=UPI00214B5046|nr:MULTISPECIES: extracellular solute-binding protein [unclassified Microbacterium]MCR2812591.1 extracellular solute-binding protein [Microbacterium sp. zg.Y1084]MCR2817613.1 extracellular solute-binding protein [Microbacterium sp. zg.Y1090]MDL5485744.1 extracellular solute-binding protein [Microbacterium sp. zg-Y1211]WIM28911.1 extracellular solute-binding protein [Microbacterium sp. zg-Y1090]
MGIRQRSQWRQRAVGAAVVVAALVLAGCGRADDGAPSGEAGAVTDGPATGTIELWAAGAEAAELPVLFDDFIAENPDVEINMTPIPEEEFVTKMTAAIAAGTVPDLVYVFTEHQPALFATEAFAPVPEGLVDEADFFASVWESGQVDGVSYGVPWFTYARVFQYRADLAEAAGLEPPQDWDDLREFAQTLKDAGVAYPLAFYVVPFDEYTAAQFDTFAHQNGGGIISDDATEWTIDSPENVEALEFYGSLFDDGFVSPDGPTSVDSVAYLAQDRIAGVLNGPWLRGWIKDAHGQEWLDEHMAALVPPAGPGGERAASIGGGNWAVLEDAANADAAWKFVRYASEPETQLAWFASMGNLPTVQVAWDDPAIADDEALEQVREAMEYGVSVPPVPTWNQVGKALGEQIERVARGTATAQEALDAAQAEAESIGVGQ